MPDHHHHHREVERIEQIRKLAGDYLGLRPKEGSPADNTLFCFAKAVADTERRRDVD